MQVISEKSKKKMVSIIALFVALICGVIAPALSHKVYADTELQFSVEVPPILEITLLDSAGATLGSSTSMEVRPSLNSAAFNEKDVTVNVGTNNEWGYNLIMSVPNTNLTSIEGGVINNLPGLDEDPNSPPTGPIGYTCSTDNANDCNFTINSWGYKLKQATATRPASNYVPVEQEISLTKTNTLTNSDKTYLSFGSRVDSTLAPGTYTATIVFTAVANVKPGYFEGVTKLQDMTSDICKAQGNVTADMSEVPFKENIIDIRDGKTYEIRKLADGNCWIVNDLRLGTVGEDLTLTSEDTNLADDEEFVISGEYIVNSGSSPWYKGSTYGGDYDYVHVYDQGGTNGYGNLYNWYTVAAGTGTYAKTSGDVSSSICPKGWRLPTSDEYIALLKAYLTDDEFGSSYLQSGNADSLTGYPLSFSLSGSYQNALIDQGIWGEYWSSTAGSGLYAYQYSFNNPGGYFIISDYYSFKYAGRSVRCVAE